MASRARAPQGLTLIEVAVGLAILVILAATALPPMGQAWARWRTQHAAEQLAGDLAEARFQAVRLGRDLQVRGRGGADWCWVVSEQPPCDCGAAPAPARASALPACALQQVSRADHPGVVLQQAPALTFSGRDGTPVGERTPAWLATPAGELLQVEVGAQGRPRICARQGAWSRVARCG